MDPYRCDCGAELDHPGADCDRCGPQGPDHDDAATDRAIELLAAASAPRTGLRTLWTFRSADGEDVQRRVCCPACSAQFTVRPGVEAQVADDDIDCELCPQPATFHGHDDEGLAIYRGVRL